MKNILIDEYETHAVMQGQRIPRSKQTHSIIWDFLVGVQADIDIVYKK